MRPHAALGGLLDVQLDRLAVGIKADRHAQPVAGCPDSPQAAHLQCFRIVEAEQRGQRGVHRQRVLTKRGAARRAQRGKLAGERLGLREREPVGRTDLCSHIRARPVPGDHFDTAARYPQPQHRGVQGGGSAPGQVEDGGAIHAVAAKLVAVSAGHTVDDHHVVGQ